MEKKNKVHDLLDLISGKEGRFLEDDKSYFGKKTVTSEQKDAFMETDCGGMIITKSKMTYGEADKIASEVNLEDIINFVIEESEKEGECYWKKRNLDRIYKGEFWWLIYSYLATKKIIPGKPDSYNNSMEYLFDEILKRLVNEKYVKADNEWRYFKVSIPFSKRETDMILYISFILTFVTFIVVKYGINEVAGNIFACWFVIGSLFIQGNFSRNLKKFFIFPLSLWVWICTEIYSKLKRNKPCQEKK